jgi:hypothetical protein
MTTYNFNDFKLFEIELIGQFITSYLEGHIDDVDKIDLFNFGILFSNFKRYVVIENKIMNGRVDAKEREFYKKLKELFDKYPGFKKSIIDDYLSYKNRLKREKPEVYKEIFE